MKWSLELPWPLLLLMHPDITGVAWDLQKGLGSCQPKSRILKNLGAVRPVLAVVTKQRGYVLGKEDSLFSQGFKGQEIMLCTVRGLVGGRLKKGELKSFKEGVLRAQH